MANDMWDLPLKALIFDSKNTIKAQMTGLAKTNLLCLSIPKNIIAKKRQRLEKDFLSKAGGERN